MGLPQLWLQSREQLDGKHVSQVIAIAGAGKLRDESDASREFREFLSLVPSGVLERYADECLTTRFDDNGLALQDIVNEVGRRLGFKVTNGRYRGLPGRTGYDGLWHSPYGHDLVIEVKISDAYRLDLPRVMGYLHTLIEQGEAAKERSSILIVVGREDTGDLEAQIRGSRYAWDVRLISVDALLRLMRIREAVESPLIERQIHELLMPHEFTKLDRIIDLVFAATEDIRVVEDLSLSPRPDDESEKGRRLPSAFHEACVNRIGQHLGVPLIRKSRTTFASADGQIVVVCLVSREHDPEAVPNYWFGFHPHQRALLRAAPDGYVALGCGSEERVLMIPFEEFDQWVDGMGTTEANGRHYWHVLIVREEGRLVLRRKKGAERIDVTRYLLP